MKQSQIKLVKERLAEDGFVSRNWALQNYISRLGAIIYILKKEGMYIEGKYYKTKNGTDFRYYEL